MNRFIKYGFVVLSGLLGACAEAPQKPPVQSVSEPEPQQQPASADCDCATPYRIALLLPLSGPQQNTGHQALNGAMMAFYELYSPLNVEMTPFDTQGTPEGVRTAVIQALDAGADVFVGPVFSENAQVAASIITPEGLSLFALSNDKGIAQDNSHILGGHLEEEVTALVQMVIESGRRNVLLFAPDNAYGKRLSDEFYMALDMFPHIGFDVMLFPDGSSTDAITKLVSEASGFEERYTHLQDVLNIFKAHWQEDGSSSQALTRTVDAFDLAQRWEELYPSTCVYEDELGPPADSTSPTTLPTDSSGALGQGETPEQPATNEQTGEQTGSVEIPLPETPVPALMPAYVHERVCEAPIPAAEEGDAPLQPADAAPEDVTPEDVTPVDAVPEVAVPEVAVQDGEAVADAASAGPESETPSPSDALAQEEATAPEPAAADQAGEPDMPSEGLAAFPVEEMIDPAEKAAREEQARMEEALQEARLGLLNDIARCITYLSDQDYEEQRGVEIIQRSMTKREVLGPPKIDTVILPLGNDRLRLTASLFDYYYAGQPNVRFLGTSQWETSGDLSDEPSLQGGKWVSLMRAHTVNGGARYTGYFNAEPSYMSALAYDAVRMALDETRQPESGVRPPGGASYITGESGVFRLLENGANQRRVTVMKIGATQETQGDGSPARAQNIDEQQYLHRMCLGAR